MPCLQEHATIHRGHGDTRAEILEVVFVMFNLVKRRGEDIGHCSKIGTKLTIEVTDKSDI